MINRKNFYVLAFVALAVSGLGILAARDSQTGQAGFDLSHCIVDPNEIFAGGPPKDGIPALTNPHTVSGRSANSLSQKDKVVGVVQNGEARAYPLAVLIWHEAINDLCQDFLWTPTKSLKARRRRP